MRKTSETVIFTGLPEYKEETNETIYYGKLVKQDRRLPRMFKIRTWYLDKEKDNRKKDECVHCELEKGNLGFVIDVEGELGYYGVSGVMLDFKTAITDNAYSKELVEEEKKQQKPAAYQCLRAVAQILYGVENDRKAYVMWEELSGFTTPLPPLILVDRMYELEDDQCIIELCSIMFQFAGYFFAPVIIDLTQTIEKNGVIKRNKALERKIYSISKKLGMWTGDAEFNRENAEIKEKEKKKVAAGYAPVELLKECYRFKNEEEALTFLNASGI